MVEDTRNGTVTPPGQDGKGGKITDQPQPARELWGRVGSVLIASPKITLDLGEFHYRFQVSQSDTITPNTLYLRVYNLDKKTVDAIWGVNGAISEFTRVVLQVGYEGGNAGVIFDGTVKQLGRGKETNVDSYLDIFASSFDIPYTFAVVNQTLAPGVSPQGQANAIGNVTAPMGAKIDPAMSLTGGTLPRGKVLFGMAKDYLRSLGQTTGTTLTFDGGLIKAVPLTGYLPGEAVELNSQTGLIGIPEATQNGVMVVALINPRITIGQRIKLNNADINQTLVTNLPLKALDGLQFFATTQADGIYRVMVVEYEGDSRGNPWYSRITALAVDPSAPPGQSVQRFG